MQRDLYPPIEPFDVVRVAVDDLHTLHVEQSGNPDGVPVVFLHGGPGSPWSSHVRRFFDPDHYRLIAFDQRGTWRSTPLGELRDNTTPHLIGDIELLRRRFGIGRWIVFCGSWGSALALAYGQAHPERCLGLVVRGISLGRSIENRWGFHEPATSGRRPGRCWSRACPRPNAAISTARCCDACSIPIPRSTGR